LKVVWRADWRNDRAGEISRGVNGANHVIIRAVHCPRGGTQEIIREITVSPCKHDLPRVRDARMRARGIFNGPAWTGARLAAH